MYAIQDDIYVRCALRVCCIYVPASMACHITQTNRASILTDTSLGYISQCLSPMPTRLADVTHFNSKALLLAHACGCGLRMQVVDISGSGVVWDSYGHIITNYRCISRAVKGNPRVCQPT